MGNCEYVGDVGLVEGRERETLLVKAVEWCLRGGSAIGRDLEVESGLFVSQGVTCEDYRYDVGTSQGVT